MVREIGSEFCENVLTDSTSKLSLFAENTFYLDSGRSAIKAIIRDILTESGVFKVYMPDFCCDTMIKPFLNCNIEVDFYKVEFENYCVNLNVDYNTDCKVVFLMDYFGFKNDNLSQIAKKMRDIGKMVIYDATQSLFSDFSDYDYAFSSLRKWFYSFDCLLTKKENFLIDFSNQTNVAYNKLKSDAANLKKEYLNEKFIDKQTFLSLYSDAEEILDVQTEEYSGIKFDLDNIDFNYISKKRKENAQFLISGIKSLNIDGIDLLFDDMNENDVPLFVPILTEQRNELRKHFISNSIYLPVHWPFTDVHSENFKNPVYDTELSLICDQRYNIDDMQRILDVLKSFFGGK